MKISPVHSSSSEDSDGGSLIQASKSKLKREREKNKIKANMKNLTNINKERL